MMFGLTPETLVPPVQQQHQTNAKQQHVSKPQVPKTASRVQQAAGSSKVFLGLCADTYTGIIRPSAHI